MKPPSRVHKWKRISMFQKKGAGASHLRKCHNKLTSAVFRLNPALLLSHGPTSPKFSAYLMSAKTNEEHLVGPNQPGLIQPQQKKMKQRSAVNPDLTRTPSQLLRRSSNYIKLLLPLGPLGSKSLGILQLLLEDSSEGWGEKESRGGMLASC